MKALYTLDEKFQFTYLLYPGPREFKTTARVVKLLSPTYYEIEYVDDKGGQRGKGLILSLMPTKTEITYDNNE